MKITGSPLSQKAVVVLFLIVSVTLITCSLQDKKPIIVSDKVEEIALKYFVDSIYLNKGLLTDTNRLPLLTAYDSIWDIEGLFYGYRIFFSDSVSGVSRPYLFAQEEIDYVEEKNKAYVSSFESMKGLQQPEYRMNLTTAFPLISEAEFRKGKGPDEWFLSVRHAIEIPGERMVELLLNNRNGEFHAFYFFIDSNGRVFNWRMKSGFQTNYEDLLSYMG